MVNRTGNFKPEQLNTTTSPTTDPWNDGFDQSNPNQSNTNQSNTNQISSSHDNMKLPSEDRETIQQVQKAKDRTFVSMVVLVMMFLLSTMILGSVSIVLVPWWKHSRGILYRIYFAVVLK